MSKKRVNLIIKTVGVSEIFILILAVFAFGFLISGAEFVSAQTEKFWYLKEVGGSTGYQITQTPSGNYINLGVTQMGDAVDILDYYKANNNFPDAHLQGILSRNTESKLNAVGFSPLPLNGGAEGVSSSNVPVENVPDVPAYGLQAKGAGVSSAHYRTTQAIGGIPAGVIVEARGGELFYNDVKILQSDGKTPFTINNEQFGSLFNDAGFNGYQVELFNAGGQEALTNFGDITQLTNDNVGALKGLGGEFADLEGISVGENGERIFDMGDGSSHTFNAAGEFVSTDTPYSTDFFGISFYGGMAHLVEGLQFAGMVVGMIQLVGGLMGADQGIINALSMSAFGGIMTYKGILAMAEEGFFGLTENSWLTTNAPYIGIGAAIAIFVFTYKEEKMQTITYECLPWEAPLGGSNCEVCNDEVQICSEYRCKALGQACGLVNEGTVDEKCVWINPNDVTAPQITPWDEPLTEGHKYTNHDILPPSLGAKIVREDGNCIQAFTPLEFGIITNEPAQCKIDIAHSEGSEQSVFDDMAYYFGDSLYKYNHTERLNLPSGESIRNSLNGTDAPEIPLDGIYNFYSRCRDANGNFNVQEFVFQICVDESPDTTPPVIVDTSILSGSYVSFEVDDVDLDVYVNEPAECKWDIESKAYEDMINEMECSDEIHEINAQQLYTCSGTLTGIKDREDNNYYFRCKDQPSKPDNERNVNVQSYEFILKGSQPLTIVDVGPNETIFGSTSSVEVDLTVETGDGAEEGKAICYFSSTGEEGSYVSMFETDNFEHKQTLQLLEGDHTYHYRCVDVGGNSAEDSVDFRVEVDEESPSITRAYRELDGLKIVTDEDADCAYSLNSCDYVFDEGLKMIYSNPSIRTNHFAEWNAGLTYYIKCRDDYGNEPSPNQCSMIASASNVR